MADEYYYELVAFLLCTGMRFGESPTDWSDIDYEECKFTYQNSNIQRGQHKNHGNTESESGKRDISLNELIKAYWQGRGRNKSIVIPITRQRRVFVSVMENSG